VYDSIDDVSAFTTFQYPALAPVTIIADARIELTLDRLAAFNQYGDSDLQAPVVAQKLGRRICSQYVRYLRYRTWCSYEIQ